MTRFATPHLGVLACLDCMVELWSAQYTSQLLASMTALLCACSQSSCGSRSSVSGPGPGQRRTKRSAFQPHGSPQTRAKPCYSVCRTPDLQREYSLDSTLTCELSFISCPTAVSCFAICGKHTSAFDLKPPPATRSWEWHLDNEPRTKNLSSDESSLLALYTTSSTCLEGSSIPY